MVVFWWIILLPKTNSVFKKQHKKTHKTYHILNKKSTRNIYTHTHIHTLRSKRSVQGYVKKGVYGWERKSFFTHAKIKEWSNKQTFHNFTTNFHLMLLVEKHLMFKHLLINFHNSWIIIVFWVIVKHVYYINKYVHLHACN